MCDDITSPCCLLNPIASKSGCLAVGGQGSMTDPCNILSPVADKTSCQAKNAANTINTATSGTSRGLLTLIIVAIVVFIVMILGVMLVFGGVGVAASMQGGSKFRSITKFIKRLF